MCMWAKDVNATDDTEQESSVYGEEFQLIYDFSKTLNQR